MLFEDHYFNPQIFGTIFVTIIYHHICMSENKIKNIFLPWINFIKKINLMT